MDSRWTISSTTISVSNQMYWLGLREPLLVLAILFSLAGSALSAPPACKQQNDFELLYEAKSEKGLFEYWERSPGSPGSEILIRHYDISGQEKWIATGGRGCSQGVSICWLMLDFAINDKRVEEGLRVEMNYFSIAGENYLMFSNLYERIIQIYFKTNALSKFNLIPPSGEIPDDLSGEDYDIPNLFVEIC